MLRQGSTLKNTEQLQLCQVIVDWHGKKKKIQLLLNQPTHHTQTSINKKQMHKHSYNNNNDTDKKILQQVSKNKHKNKNFQDLQSRYRRTAQKYRLKQTRFQVINKQMENCTHNPQINPVSRCIAKIAQQIGTRKPLINLNHYQKIQKTYQQSKQQKEENELKECTFTPNLIPLYILITRSRIVDQYIKNKPRYLSLYQDSIQRNKKNLKSIQKQKNKFNYAPTINVKSKKIVNSVLFLQKQRSRFFSKRNTLGTQLNQSFRPKTGRGPKTKRSNSVYDHLFQLSKSSKSKQCNKLNYKLINLNSEKILKDKKLDRYRQIFKLLDEDDDGLISPQFIALENLSSSILNLINPIIQQMRILHVILNFHQFKDAMERLYKVKISNRNLNFYEKSQLLQKSYSKLHGKKFQTKDYKIWR